MPTAKKTTKLGPGGAPRDRDCESHCGCGKCCKALANDAEIARLEEKLKAMHAARAGRWIVSIWFWCAGCGAHRVAVDHAPPNGPHMRDGLCDGCRAAREQAAWYADHLAKQAALAQAA
ncbi:MAG: hypothetical protein EKK55_13505 [Rhodocyclaceae bacterium]|nr:MAG: hypothetical protein EKK55_13505 [Rhodocyclaceae bacterium]